MKVSPNFFWLIYSVPKRIYKMMNGDKLEAENWGFFLLETFQNRTLKRAQS